ncbi:MAG TPA: phasin family protein [Casimicrobiaceae bacterium]|nr:phasin family protein [Casimicrobiaceae bacterium]
MATKNARGSATAAKGGAKRRATKRTAAPRAKAGAHGSGAGEASAPRGAAGALGQMPRMPKMLTPEQAIDMYKTNARMALDVINAAIEGAERLRRKQFEGEEQARAFQRKHVRAAGEATDPQSLMALGQGAAQEALEKSMHYWGEMFDLIVEIQKRLFTLIEEQTQGVPGVKEAKAAMALMPDLGQMQKVVSAMQGVVSSGGNAFESMQRVMGDFARLAQGSMGGRR